MSEESQAEEFELSFVYGVMSSSPDANDFIDDMERLIVDFVATSMLRCAGDGSSETPQLLQLRKREDGKGGDEVTGVIRVRYHEQLGLTTSTSKFVVRLSLLNLCLSELVVVSNTSLFF